MIKRLLKKGKKVDNAGFSLVELLVVMAILGVIAVIIYTLMTSSSRFYQRASSDADIQMEAQLVANTISDLIIDCEVNIRYQREVSEQIPEAFNSGEGSGDTEEEGGSGPAEGEENSNPNDIQLKDPNDGKTLEIDNSNFQFLIINSADDKLYYVERTADPSTGRYTGSFNLANAELLAENVSQFSVDLSRLKGKGKENIVTFSLTYNKGKRTYTGIYQVNLRNQVTVNEVVTEAEEKRTSVDKLVISPDRYVVIKGKEHPALETASDRNLTFNVNYKANNLMSMDNLFTWSMDSGYGYEFPPAQPTGAEATINLPADYDLNTLNGADFRITAQCNVSNKAGEKLTASAKVHFVKVQSVTVAPRSGIINGQASTNSSVLVNALVDGWNLNNGDKYVTWTLQYNTDKDSTWRNCTSDIATMGESRTSAYIQIGDKPDDSYHFKVTATSKFDPEWSGEFEFDIFTPPPPDYPNEACRAVEIDLLSYAEQHPESTGHATEIEKIIGFENLYVQNVPGWDGNSADLFEVKPVDGRLKLYLNYEDYKYQSVMQLINYYDTATVDMPCVLRYIRADNGREDTLNIVFKLQLEPTMITAGQTYQDGCNIVIPYGGNVDIPFTVSGYNITAKNHIGVYLNGDNVNANTYGMLDLNNYIAVNYTGPLGTREKLIKVGSVRLSSKSSNTIRPVGATETIITVDSMYRLLNYMELNGTRNHKLSGNAHISYNVYIANVEGADVYVPGPNDGVWSKNSIGNGGLPCSGLAPSNVNGTISIVTVNGNEIYQLDYAGSKYYYNKTYHFWQEQ